MKLGMLTQWFDPETGGAALPGVYAREFVKQGHDVGVLTGFPNYPEGRLYPGYKLRARSHEQFGEGLRVTRVPLHPSHSSSAIGRVANYASFSLSAALLGARALHEVDAIWVYNSPVTVALPLLTHSRWGRTPYFLHVQDLWPDSLVESGMIPSGRLGDQAAKLVTSIVQLTERKSAVIGVISKGVRELILERNPRVDPSRIVYVPNPTNESLFRPAPVIRAELGIQKRPNEPIEVMYAGAIGHVQGLETLLDAARILQHRTDIKFTLVGDGISRERLQLKAETAGLANVEFLGRVPQAQIPALMARADVQLVSLAANPFLRYTTPSKIPSILASQLPIVAQLEGDGAAMIRDSGGGVAVSPGSPEQLAEAILHLADAGHDARSAMGQRGRHFYEANLSAHAAAARITSSLDAAIGTTQAQSNARSQELGDSNATA